MPPVSARTHGSSATDSCSKRAQHSHRRGRAQKDTRRDGSAQRRPSDDFTDIKSAGLSEARLFRMHTYTAS